MCIMLQHEIICVYRKFSHFILDIYIRSRGTYLTNLHAGVTCTVCVRVNTQMSTDLAIPLQPDCLLNKGSFDFFRGLLYQIIHLTGVNTPRKVSVNIEHWGQYSSVGIFDQYTCIYFSMLGSNTSVY